MKSTPSMPFADIPGSLPDCSVPEEVNTSEIEQLVLSKLNNLDRHDWAEESVLRDIVALTGTWRTIQSLDKVFPKLQELFRDNNISSFRLGTTPTKQLIFGWLDVSVVFQTHRNGVTGNCAGVASIGLFPDGQWRLWLLRVWLENFQDHGHPDVLAPSTGLPALSRDDGVYDVVVIGAGQSGLSSAGRLHALGLKYVLLERYPNIGDVWRKRYASLKWHTLKEYGNLPFGRTYLPDDDDLLPAARVADSHQAWAKAYGLNVRTSTTIRSARYDTTTRLWTVKAVSPTGESILKAKNLILSIGPGAATPAYPDWAAPEKITDSGFNGIVMHGSSYVSCDGWKGQGKRGVVVGVANTGHDVAEDMADAGMHTTMIQRSPTFILPAEWLHMPMEKDYNAEKTTEQGDRDSYTYPVKHGREMTMTMIHSLIRAAPDRFDELEAAGFKVDRFGDLFVNLTSRFGGHYIDTGNCQRIVDGEIKVVGKPIKSLDAKGLLFEDGSVLPADVIVLATGFDHDFRKQAATIVGDDIANQMEEYWGLDSEGELRGQAKIAGFPNLYCQGGDIRHARWTSRFIALQIQAELLGQRLAMSKL